MSKIQGSLSQAFQFQSDTGKTKGKDKSSDKSSASSEQRTSSSSGPDDLPGVGFGSQPDLSQGGFDTNERSQGVLDVVEERQRRLQEDGIGDKLLGGVGDHSQRVLHRNLNGTSRSSAVSGTQGVSALQNVEAMEQRSRVRSVGRSSLSAQREIAGSEETAAVKPRQKGPALDDDLPRVGFNQENK